MKVTNHNIHSLEELENFSFDDFYQRWSKARYAALLVLAKHNTNFFQKTEAEIILELSQNISEEEILKSVFDYSRKLGLSFSSYYKLYFDLNDIRNFLQHVNMPCFQGEWNQKNSAFVLTRKGCEQGKSHGKLFCHYYKEALDGLIMGLCDEERLARHHCLTYDEELCEDIFYTESSTRPKLSSQYSSPPQFAPLSHELIESLSPVIEKFQRMKCKIEVKGMAQKTLYYSMEGIDAILCGSSSKIFQNMWQKEIEKIIPGIFFQDVTPLAVIGDGK